MEIKYLTIGIEGQSIDKIQSMIEADFFSRKIEFLKKEFQINTTIEDIKEELNSTKNFLANNNLQDENNFFNVFDIIPFSLKIDFNYFSSNNYIELFEPMVYLLGKQLSSEMNCRCIVMFENMRIPISLFENGNLKDTFFEFNQFLFAKRIWYPKTIES